MNTNDLVEQLRKRYETAEKREKALSLHLFGVVFAKELEGQPINEIAEQATGYISYGTEIRKGIRLARYVEPKAGAWD